MSYEIKEILETRPNKTCLMVSFNKGKDEYYEVESTDEKEIDKILTEVSEQSLIDNAIKEVPELSIESGKIISK